MFKGNDITISDVLLGKLQSRIGEIMQYKGRLIPYTRSSDPSIASKANELFQNQKIYEAKLLEASGKISQAKEGRSPWPSTLEIASWGMMIRPISKHIEAVKKFLATSGKPPELSLMDQINWPIVGLGGAAVAGLWYYKKKRR